MKIGILTFHNTINYGATLQAFALYKTVKKLAGNDVEIINYRSDYISKEKRLMRMLERKDPKAFVHRFSTVPFEKKRCRLFDGFVDKQLNMTRPMNSKEELKAAPVIPAEELEAETLSSIDEIEHTKTVEEMLEALSAPAAATELGAAIFEDHTAAAVEDVTPEAIADIAEPRMEMADFAAGEATEVVEEEVAEAAAEVAEPVIEATEPEIEAAEPVIEAAQPEFEVPEPAIEVAQPVVEGFVAKEEPTVIPDEVAQEGLKPGLSNTMVMTGVDVDKEADDSFSNYGEKEAEELRQIQAEAAEAAEEVPAAPAPAEEAAEIVEEAKKEVKAKPKKKEKGGAGRTVLKVLLIILIIIFVIELAGIAIKWLAPDSSAAEAIDNQLNKIIHLITGDEPDYNISGIDYEV